MTSARVLSNGVLMAAAFEPELAELRRALVGSACEKRVQCATVGIGLVEAALGTAAALERYRPTAAIPIGTCGSYGGTSVANLDVDVASRFVLADAAGASGKAAFVGTMAESCLPEDGIVSALADGSDGTHRRAVGTTLGITTDDEVAAIMAAHGNLLAEHLEAYAFAVACVRAKVPFGIALGVANRVGATGRDEWRAHHGEASARASRVVMRAMGG